ncbi:hypothetical protein DL764_003584 [Monosporascus ibericus]|uniref:CBF1-interacting co-repressor CIR N-terminal domain-containing protein n=1 Tax=Monosporascus ibericus TaxID=155417 RepID=A0A4Q4TJB9_9PEZI|nr:hypothetical protein DL764_003584 [Monosporascus ibericus]
MSLLLKKSWHPALMKNQARVYEAEQAEIAERKKTAARLQEIKDERAKEALQADLEKAGGKPRLNRVDWMYEGPSDGQTGTAEELEGFLLGKRRIDNILTRGSERESLKKQAAAGPDVTLAPKLNERDTVAKLREDPLLAIKRKEQEAYEAMVSDPIRRQQLLASMGKTDEKHSSRRKEDRHSRRHRHRSHSREHRHRKHRRSDSRERDDSRDRRHRHRRSDSRDRSTSMDRYESRRSRHHERSGRERSASPERTRDYARSRRDRSPSPRRSGYNDEHRPNRRRDYSEEPPRERRRYDRYQEGRRDARDGKQNDARRNDRYGGDNGGGGSTSGSPGATAVAEERARKLAAMQANASDLDQDRAKRLTALEEKERLEREADEKARERSGKYGDKEFVHGLRRQLIK